MNYLLSLNKRNLIIMTAMIILLITIIFTFKYIQIANNSSIPLKLIAHDSDITKPKFTISGNNQEIAITAKEGDFLSDEKILLKKNVIFQSKKFKIFSDKVIFDKKKLIASSTEKSKFIAKNTSIISNGFDITDNGNIINFKGKTIITLK